MTWEQKTPEIAIRIAKHKRTEVAYRIDSRGGEIRVDYTYALCGGCLPWEAIDGGHPLPSIPEAKALVDRHLRARS